MPKHQQRRRYGIRHERRRRARRGHDDCFRVRATLGFLAGVERTPVEVIDSQRYQYGGLDPEGFDEATRREHGDRRQDGRAEKGRVFYLTAGGVVVAFVVFHVPPPPGPLIVENLALDQRLLEATRARIRRALFHAVLEASELVERQPNRLAWATDDDRRLPGIRALGFEPTSRPRPTDCTLRHYLEREFPSTS
jgi:hypothetical protein